MTSMISVCPGCGLVLPSADGVMDTKYNASWACRELSGEVSAYTISLGDEEFIHQLVVDAYCAQHAGPMVKPIGIAFALIGLLLTYERGYTGRQVQQAHIRLANKSKVWPRFEPPWEKAHSAAGSPPAAPRPGGAVRPARARLESPPPSTRGGSPRLATGSPPAAQARARLEAPPPGTRGGSPRLTVLDVVESAPGDERNAMLMKWGKSVWDGWKPEHDNVRALVERNLYA